MLLTDTQRDMLDGKYGKGKAMAARILTAVGESFRAVRLVPVTRVHVSLSAQGADIWFAEKMVQAGAVCSHCQSRIFRMLFQKPLYAVS